MHNQNLSVLLSASAFGIRMFCSLKQHSTKEGQQGARWIQTIKECAHRRAASRQIKTGW